jgi:hypothetical protein
MHYMTINSYQDFISKLLTHLTGEERANGVAYAAGIEKPFAAGTRLLFPGVEIEVTAESWLAFIDRVPTANWGHPARYLLMSTESDETSSFETRLPPFQPHAELRWRVVYKAPSVPDAAVATPQ